jgi:parallel beta-helix repeat protein
MTVHLLLCRLLGMKKPGPRKAGAIKQTRLDLEKLEDRWVPSTLHVDPSGLFNGHPAFTTIQAAVNAANAGDTILVDPGTYKEQVTFSGSSKNNIDLAAQSGTPVIKTPQTLTGSKAIVDVNASTGVTIQGFKIAGPSNGAARSISAGVMIEGGGSATVNNNVITGIQDNTFDGTQNGVGIQVGRFTSGTPTTGTATITDNTINNYQKGGIVVTNTGSNASISDNVINGAGSTGVVAQNGIEISAGATGTVADNTVKNNIYNSPVSPAQFAASGILIDQAGNNVNVSNNTVTNNDAGIWVLDTSNAAITDNNVSGSTYFGIALDIISTGDSNDTVKDNVSNHNTGDGIDLFGAANSTVNGNTTSSNGGNGIMLDQGSTHNTVNNNVSKSNAGIGILMTAATSSNSITNNTLLNNIVFDAEDLSVGTGTGGTANTWTNNTTGTKNPGGLH